MYAHSAGSNLARQRSVLDKLSKVDLDTVGRASSQVIPRCEMQADEGHIGNLVANASDLVQKSVSQAECYSNA